MGNRKQIVSPLAVWLLLGASASIALGDDPPATVAYQTAVNQERQWNGFGSGGWRFGGGMARATSSPKSNETIVLDFYDPAAKKPVWEGRATKAIDSSGSQEKTEKILDKTMQKLLKNYPPKQK